MSKIARVISSPIAAVVEGIDDETKFALSEAMSFTVEGHEHMNCGDWSGRSTLYDWSSGKFPAGFVPTAISVLSQRGYNPQIFKKPLPAPLGEMPTQENPLVDDFDPDPERDYQFQAPVILEKHGMYIARCATGGGKSRIAKLCVKRIGRKTMFLTTRKVLFYQMGKDFERSGFKVSYVGDGHWDTSGDVVCAMVPTLADRLSPMQIDPKMSQAEVVAAANRHSERLRETVDFLDKIEFLIAEEAHESGGNSYYNVCKATRNAHYRLALTATPMMRDGESNVRLIGMFGPIRLEVSEKRLIEAGILARPIFKFIPVNPPPTVRRTTPWQKAEENGIMLNHERNKLIVAEVYRATLWGLTSMVLIKRQKHGKLLQEMLQRNGLRGEFIWGESTQAKRDAALAKLASGEYDYIIGSVIFDVGVDVPSVGVMVIAGGGKAEVAHRQRVGRVLRRKKHTPNFSFIVDFQDQGNKHLVNHAKQRRAVIEQTDGFCEGILPRGKDFDLRGLGFQRAVKN